MIKKYLIVDSRPKDVLVLEKELVEIGFDVAIFDSYEKSYIWNENNKPLIVQLGGLNGNFLGVIDKLKGSNPKANYILFSRDPPALSTAEMMSIPFYDKREGFDSLLVDVKLILYEPDGI